MIVNLFRKQQNSTDSTNAINSVFYDDFDVKTCQLWFKKFRLGD